MGIGALVSDIEVLRDLEAALRKYGSTLEEALIAIDRRVQVVLEWLADRVQESGSRVRQREDELRDAQERLRRCSKSEDSRCAEEREAVGAAERRLADAHRRLELAVSWLRRIEAAAEAHRGQRIRLRTLVTDHASNALAFLERRRATLEDYVALHVDSGDAPPLPPWFGRSRKTELLPWPGRGLPTFSRGALRYAAVPAGLGVEPPSRFMIGTIATGGPAIASSRYLPSWASRRGDELFLGFSTMGPPGALPFLRTAPAPAVSYLRLQLGTDSVWREPPGFGTVPASFRLNMSTSTVGLKPALTTTHLTTVSLGLSTHDANQRRWLGNPVLLPALGFGLSTHDANQRHWLGNPVSLPALGFGLSTGRGSATGWTSSQSWADAAGIRAGFGGFGGGMAVGYGLSS